MRDGGRIAAAIDILDEIAGRHRPASEALKDWARGHRFAGSGDRHAIGTLVFDVLRHRNSLSAHMGDKASRALVLAALKDLWQWPLDRIAAHLAETHGPGELTAAERSTLESPPADDLPPHVAGDYPEWLSASFARAFGDHAADEGKALARRAPIDLRVNTLKADRPRVLAALEKFGAIAGKLSPWAVRIAAPGPDQRNPAVEAEPAHGKGWFEVQDEASQLAAFLTGARSGEQVADICAGAGGKTLALAAMMANKGQIFAHDADRHRLRPIFERLQRAGVRNVQVVAADEGDRIDALTGRLDCLLIDAPCSGSGSWRRKPDAKWRLTDRQLAARGAEQAALLERGAALLKTGGRLVYVTCSVLPEENADQIAAFLERNPGFEPVPYREQWQAAIGTPAPESAIASDFGLQLTPARHDTDGFFISVLRRGS
ncbi:MAG: RsmB/NOP family class I SAM-dependent RNA methyltransferase [Rhizobiales bacterium]|nr:RsmB/NOP family class I SAM-dependent RNA methyltransferase [Hyphomicrobiales bacterium]